MTRNDKKWEIETTDTPGILVAKVMIMMIHHRIFLGRIVFWGDGSMVGTLESQENYQKVAEGERSNEDPGAFAEFVGIRAPTGFPRCADCCQ